MEASPFPHQGPLPPADVRGRDSLLSDLVGRVTEGRLTAVLGPRRFGKTSLLRRLAADLTEVATVWVDLYEVTSLIDVAIRVDAGLSALTDEAGEESKRIASSVELNLGLARVELGRPPASRPDPAARLSALLDVIVTMVTRRPVLLVMDEFSSIGRVYGVAGMLRTALQHHYQQMGIVFAGSMPSVMRELFTDRPQPFYAQADLVDIGPLTTHAITEIIGEGFTSTGRDAGPLPPLISGFSEGHPQRMMQLADACWRLTPRGESASAQQWEHGLEAVRLATAAGMERLFSSFERRERDVLRLVAGGGALYGAAASLLDIPPGAAQHARGTLLDDGDLLDTADGLKVTDPLMADWIRHRFPL